MASKRISSEEEKKLYKFTKILTLKVAQVVVQSRQGKKITAEYNAAQNQYNDPAAFNLSIPDEPEVNEDATKILNGEIVNALSKVLCVEILLRTSDGDSMVLEVWTIRMKAGTDDSTDSASTIYYRMSLMLKSTLSISRITPAYKLSRLQQKEAYKISHSIYGGAPDKKLLDILGEKYKTIKVSELRTPIGTIVIEVSYRTNMTLFPVDKPKALEEINLTTNDDIMLVSNHFHHEINPVKDSEKRQLDLSKPLRAGAFVDSSKIKELQDTLSQNLPPEPPMKWLLAEKERLESKMKRRTHSESVNIVKPGGGEWDAGASCSAPTARAGVPVPTGNGDARCDHLMEFPFANGSPLADLAVFYKDCLKAKSTSDEWTVLEQSASGDSDSLSLQLKMYEDAVSEFDNFVASMCSNSENDDN